VSAFEEYEYEFRVPKSNSVIGVGGNTSELGSETMTATATAEECVSPASSILQNRETVLNRAAHAVFLSYNESE
jgi:hypothetical protein